MAYTVRLLEAHGLERQGDDEGAVTALNAAIGEDSERFEAYLSLADIRLRRGDTNEAILNYELALRYCGSSPTNVIPLTAQVRERVRIADKLRQLKSE